MHYSAAELAEMRLCGVPGSKKGVLLFVEREAWSFVEVVGNGGVRKEFQPPEAVMAQIRERTAQQLLADSAKLPVPSSLKTVTSEVVMGVPVPAAQTMLQLTDAQRLRTDCRKGVLMSVERLMAGCGIGKEAAITAVLVEAKKDPEGQLARALKLAEDERGRKGSSTLPSVRTIKRWFAADKVGALAPKQVQREMRVPTWAPAFLAIWQTPQKPSVSAAYRIFSVQWTEGVLPSVDQVRRFIGKLGNVSREVGRMGSRDIKNIKPFVRRTFDQLVPGDVYSADGHCFDAEVRHPLTGKPFRPEITSIIDIATRRVVGFSVDLAESGLAVIDALRYSAVHAGVCATFYVDNGSGYVNDMLKDEATGLLNRLGITMTHSLPYNSQARGVIERLHQSLWVAAAKELTTYIGADMDRQAGQLAHKVTRRALKHGGTQPLMGWPEFMAFCHRKVADYNARSHKSLGGRTPDQVWAEKGATADLHRVDAAEAEHLFHPQATRKVVRGEVQLFNNKYFSAALEEFHGEFVRVSYDVHDANWVWVYDQRGAFIAKAGWGANEAHYMPMPVIEQNRVKREEGRLARLNARVDDVMEGLTAPLMGQLAAPEITLTQQQFNQALNARPTPAVIDVVPAEPVAIEVASVSAMTEVRRPLFNRAADRYRWLMAHRGAWTGADREWLTDYVASDEYAERVDIFENECIAWQGDASGVAV
ncbi:Mu transposase C-terminal domain-containing protein [Jeongeupia chitinilytica]|nr:Mu transposase C-terminal domain-containing protein [Jeongeupia chitinilytica]